MERANSNKGDLKNLGINDALRQNITNEMFLELQDTFRMVADNYNIMPYNKLTVALKALGMSTSETSDDYSSLQNDGIDFDKFVEITLECMKHPNWAANEMNEVFNLFDKNRNGYIIPSEFRQLLAKIGENVTETELADQLREFDIDRDEQVRL